MKNYTKRGAWFFRLATCKLRKLPDFLIIGAQKAGTSSLYSYIVQHPQIAGSYKKEVHFFDGGLDPRVDSFKKGIFWYQAHFPLKASRNILTFEASPLYLYNPLVPERIANALPHVKLIVLLRNPIERAISQYFHSVRDGQENLPIMQALDAEENRLAPIIKNKDYKNLVFIHNSYKSRGIYHEQLRRYFRYFPKERILILESERFFADIHGTLKKIFLFLEVSPHYEIADTRPQNIGKNRQSVDSKVYEKLAMFFAKHNEALRHVLGYGFDWT